MPSLHTRGHLPAARCFKPLCTNYHTDIIRLYLTFSVTLSAAPLWTTSTISYLKSTDSSTWSGEGFKIVKGDISYFSWLWFFIWSVVIVRFNLFPPQISLDPKALQMWWIPCLMSDIWKLLHLKFNCVAKQDKTWQASVYSLNSLFCSINVTAKSKPHQDKQACRHKSVFTLLSYSQMSSQISTNSLPVRCSIKPYSWTHALHKVHLNSCLRFSHCLDANAWDP